MQIMKQESEIWYEWGNIYTLEWTFLGACSFASCQKLELHQLL